MDATTFFLPTDVGTFAQALNEILYELPERIYPLKDLSSKERFVTPGHRAWPRETRNVDPKRRSTVLEVDASYRVVWKETGKVRFSLLQNVISFRATPRKGAKMGITVQAQCNHYASILTDYFQELLAEIAKRWPYEKQKCGPTDNTQKRAQVFKQLKDKYPQWGYDTVALKARDELEDPNITGESVRYVYRVMGWKWERADRVR